MPHRKAELRGRRHEPEEGLLVVAAAGAGDRRRIVRRLERQLRLEPILDLPADAVDPSARQPAQPGIHAEVQIAIDALFGADRRAVQIVLETLRREEVPLLAAVRAELELERVHERAEGA